MNKELDESIVSGTALGTFDVFSKLDVDARNQIARRMQLRHVDKGQYVVSARTSDNDVYFVINGSVRVCSFTHNGKQIHFEELTPGMMFGELSAIDNGGRSSDCISVMSCTLATIKAEDFKDIIAENRTVLDSVLLRLVSMVRGNMQRVYEFSALSVAQRVRCEILRLASHVPPTGTDIILESVPTHAEIAARISTHREAVTRELKALESVGMITWRPRKYIVHDVAGLSEFEAD